MIFGNESVVMMVAMIMHMAVIVRMVVAMQEMRVAVARRLPHKEEDADGKQQSASDSRNGADLCAHSILKQQS